MSKLIRGCDLPQSMDRSRLQSPSRDEILVQASPPGRREVGAPQSLSESRAPSAGTINIGMGGDIHGPEQAQSWGRGVTRE